MTGDLAAALYLNVAAASSEIRLARHAVVDHLTTHSVPSVIIDDLELVTSELITNAITHSSANGAVYLEIAVSDSVVLRVSNVGSAADIPPTEEWRLGPSPPEASRGLGIVRRLCDEVSVEQRGDRVVVTCRRQLPDGGVPT
jgi:anti-sigma regulatory factor (Ser/Thr protein kinase)